MLLIEGKTRAVTVWEFLESKLMAKAKLGKRCQLMPRLMRESTLSTDKVQTGVVLIEIHQKISLYICLYILSQYIYTV